MKKIIVIIGGALLVIALVVVILIIISQLGKRDESFYHNNRTHALQNLHDLFESRGKIDLLDAKKIVYPYDINILRPALVSVKEEPSYYQKMLRYKIIRCDDWWGIVELEYGIIGKYFLMITRDGDIVRFDKPFLPEQKLAEYPPKYDIEKHIYPAYLDKLPVAAQTNVSAKPEDQKGKDATPDPK